MASSEKPREKTSSAMLTLEHKIARAQRTLRWLEEDVPRLEVRVAELSPERQNLAKGFAARVREKAQAELQKLMAELPAEEPDSEVPAEPAD